MRDAVLQHFWLFYLFFLLRWPSFLNQKSKQIVQHIIAILSYGTWTELFAIKISQKMWICGYPNGWKSCFVCLFFPQWPYSAPFQSSKPKGGVARAGLSLFYITSGQGCEHLEDVNSGNWDLAWEVVFSPSFWQRNQIGCHRLFFSILAKKNSSLRKGMDSQQLPSAGTFRVMCHWCWGWGDPRHKQEEKQQRYCCCYESGSRSPKQGTAVAGTKRAVYVD